MKTFTLSDEEHKKLLELYQRAENTPVMAMSVADGLAGRDFASTAWNEVRNFMDELGKKYGYKAQTAQIDPEKLTFEAEPA